MIFGLNFIPPDEAQLLFNLKETLKAAGWVVVASGNGISFGSYNLGGNDVITNADGLRFLGANSGSWFVVKQPTITTGQPGAPGGREFLFYRALNGSGTGIAGGVRYARYDSSGYVTGGSAAVRPTATHDFQWPNIFLGFVAGNPSSQFVTRQHVLCDNAPPYAWINLCWRNGGIDTGQQGNYNFVYEFCTPAIATDPEPYIWGTPNASFPQSAWTKGVLGGATQNLTTWYGAGTASEQVNSVLGCGWGHSAVIYAAPNSVGINLWNSKDESLPIFWTGNTELSGLRHPKGVGHLVRWAGTSRTLGQLVDSKNRIIVQDVSLPWDGVNEAYI